jgi:two-component system, sensor histidine kinase LadS
MLRGLFILLIVVFILQDISAQTVVLKESGHSIVKGNLQFWRDYSGNMTVDDIEKLNLLPFDPQRSPNFGFDKTTYWFKVEVNNQSNQSDWLLEIGYSPLDQIDFYIQPDSGTTLIHKASGDIFPISIRDIPHRHPIFVFNIQPGESKYIFLRVQTTSSVQLPLHLWHRDAFTWMSFKVQIFNGLFYGAMLLMVLYQLFLFCFVRDRITFYYILTLISMTNIVSFFQGYSFLYLYPNNPGLNHYFAIFSGPVFVVLSTLLTRSFLNLREFSKRLDSLLIGNMVLDLCATAVMLFDFRILSYKYHHYFILIHCIIVLISAGFCLYKKYRPSLYYLMAWVTPLLAASVFTLSNLGFVPGYMSTNYLGVMMGCIFQMLFISFALGERWNVLIKENQLAKELELKRGIEENERLEREVKLRTEEIQQQKNKLEEAHRIKDKLFSIVSHDIKSPLNSLKLALMLTHSGNISPEEFKEVTGGLETHLGKTTEFIQNLLQWAKLQLKGESFEPIKLNLRAMAEEMGNLLELEMKQKKIQMRLDIEDGCLDAYADPVMIRSTFRNLLTNAIKFTPVRGTIAIQVKKDLDEIIVSVSDTGVGIHVSHQRKIFTLESITTLGTQQEAGTGLGLVLCKEFVEKNSGRIWFESAEGTGTKFSFSLPEYHESFAPELIKS